MPIVEQGREFRIAKLGLDLAAYPDKWKKAKALADRTKHYNKLESMPYWERVRAYYLLLGGRKMS